MPGVYREKQCPKCGVLHRKRRIHCSQSCGNTGRPQSEKQKQIARKLLQDMALTPEGIAASQLGFKGIKAEDFELDIPTFYDIPEGYDSADDW